MTSADWQFASEIAQGLGSILSVFLAGWAAFIVQRYTRRKDRLDYLNHRWSIQQDINLQNVSDPKIALNFEKLVYGSHSSVTEQEARTYFTFFLILNLVQNDWFAFREGMISRKEWDDYGFATLNLVARHASTIRYLVRHRGYSAEFADEVIKILERAAPIPPSQED